MTETTTKRLMFGYNAGLPDGTTEAWGARLIVGQDGWVDLVPNRTDCFADGVFRDSDLRGWLDNDGALGKALDNLADMLKAYRVRTREAEQVTVYEDDRGVIVGNSNASAGYFYMAAYLKEVT